MGEQLTLTRPGRELASRSLAVREARTDPGPPEVVRKATAMEGTFAGRTLQPRLVVGGADDPFEREAERTAETVTLGGRGPTPSVFDEAPIAGFLMRLAQRATGKAEPPTKKDDDDKPKKAQKAAAGHAGPDVVPAGIEAGVHSMSAGGAPLAESSRSVFEGRFGYDFSDVRVHTGTEAAGAAVGLGARAFTVGDHIFFGPGEYQPTSSAGQRLIAHELTHTIQQKPGAARAARLLAAPRRVQRLFEGPKAAIAEKIRGFITKDFPPWDLITLIIGYDPIRSVSVKGSTKDWIRAAMKLAPDGEALFEKLDSEGKVDAIAKWWDGEVAKLDLTYDRIVALVNKALDLVSAGDVFDPVGAWNKKLKPVLLPVITRVWDFIKAVGAKVLQVVKDVVLKAVSDWAQRQRGYPLLTMALGKDPVTGEEVKPTLKGVIFAVLDLVPGGEPIKENLEKSKAIEKAATWFKTEFGKLKLTWEGIKALFTQAWDAFKVADLLNPKSLFEKMWAIFGPPVVRLLAFLIAVAKKILEFIFEGAMLIAGPIGLQIVGIVQKIGATFNRIVEDPVAFVGHLVDAVKKGIQQFAKNILEHLKTGVINWLVGTLEGAGLVLPKVWDLRGILDLVLQILGITYAKIRVKLVKATNEKTVSMLETAFGFIKTLVTEGPAAAWKEIVAAIGSLWDMVIGGVRDWAITKIVTAAILKLVTMFNPAGAIIQAIIATYNTIAFFMERIKQILAFVEAVVDSVANIAMGKIDVAANWVEKAMARTIPVILGFLARLIGLGDVSGAVKKVIAAIQEKVDKAIDSVITWVVNKAKSMVGGKEDAPGAKKDALLIPDTEVKKTFAMSGEGHTLTARVKGGQIEILMSSITDTLVRLAVHALQEVDEPKLTPQFSDQQRRDYRLLLLDLRDEAKPENINRAYRMAGMPPGIDQWVSIYITDLIERDLVPLAKHGVRSIETFVQSVPDVRFLPTEYQDGDWIRDNLYVSATEWKTIKTRDDPSARKQIADQVELANTTNDIALWNRLQIAPNPDGKAGYLIPSTAVRGKYTRADVFSQSMARDHVEPLAKHWTQYGHTQTDAEREPVGKGTGGYRLELITTEYNSRKQALGFEYRWDVHGTFASDRAASPIKSWRVKGRPFLRTATGPAVTEQTGS